MPNEGGIHFPRNRPTGNLYHRSCSISSSPSRPSPQRSVAFFGLRCRFILTVAQASHLCVFNTGKQRFLTDLRKSVVAKSAHLCAPFALRHNAIPSARSELHESAVSARKFSGQHTAEIFPPLGFVTPAFCSLQSEIQPGYAGG